MTIPVGLEDRCARWTELKRWERRELAGELRALGLSYNEISRMIPVSKGSLSVWCRDTPLDNEALSRPANRQVDGRRRAALAQVGQRRRAARLQEIAAIRTAARSEVSLLALDPMWVAGLVAYWAEGGKTPNRVAFSNSDPDMVRLFIRWSERYLGRGTDEMSCSLHLHSGQDEGAHVRYWSQVTGIDVSRFTKTFIKPPGTGHRKRILYRGVATVRPRRSTDLLHKVLGWIEGYASLLDRLE